MKQWIMVIDVAKCHNCNDCFLSCKDEHVGNDWSPVTKPMPRHGHYWRKIECVERGADALVDVQYRPGNCMMCENAPCEKAGRGAVTRREDGILLIDPEKAKGRKDLVDACPYGAIWWNEEYQVPQKCTFCAHLLDQGWTETRCSHSCPTGATKFYAVEKDELEGYIKENHLSRYHDKFGTKPHVFYKNLELVTSSFFCGAVVKDGECCEGAAVTAEDGNGEQFSTTTNPYGEFKLRGLKDGTYKIVIQSGERKKELQAVELRSDQYLGEIELK